MAKDKDKKDPYGPVRKQDPYVTGTGRGYISGGEGNGGNGGGNGGNKDESCGEQTAKMVVVGTALFLTLRALLRKKS